MKVTITETIEKTIDVPSPCKVNGAYVANLDDIHWVFVYADSPRKSIIVSTMSQREARLAEPIEPKLFNDAWDRTLGVLNKLNFDF